MSSSSLERAAIEVREQCIASKLRNASRAITQLYDDAIAESGIRSTQFTVLVALAQAPLIPMTKLAEVLSLDRTTLTRNLTPLVRDGLVEERPGPDKRVRAYALTAQGRKVLESAIAGWRKAQAAMARALAEDRGELERILTLATRSAKR